MKASKIRLNFAKYDKSRTEVLSSAVFYLPRDTPVEDFYRPGTQEKKFVPSKNRNNKGYTRIRNS